jgi:hypothetical protein
MSKTALVEALKTFDLERYGRCTTRLKKELSLTARGANRFSKLDVRSGDRGH